MLNKLVVDIAYYNKGVDPSPLHDASVQLVILKVDNWFERNGKILADSGMPIAAYHWIDPTKDAERQVSDTLRDIRESGLPVLAVFADFEQWWSRWDEWYRAIRREIAWELVSRFRGNRLSRHARDVFKAFEDAGVKTFGYTRASFVNEFAPQATNWIANYRWWLAHYITVEPQVLTWADLKTRILPRVDFLPARPPGLSQDKVIGHQFTGDKLSLPGLYGDTQRTRYAAADVNLFDDGFLQEIGAVPSPQSLPDLLHEAIVTASPRLNVRSGPSTSFPILYKLMYGTPVEITELRDGWARLRTIQEAWCSATYLEIESEPTPVPPPPVDVEPVTPVPIEPEAPEIPEVVDVNLPGVTYQRMKRYNANCHILVIDPSNVRFHVTRYRGLKTVSHIARSLNADIVVNGDGWGTAGYPNSIAASEGKVYQKKQYHFRPWINISRNNKITFDHNWRRWKKKLYNTISGDRYLIDKNGEYMYGIRATNKDPRTAAGVTRDGKLILIVADGRTQESQGLSFRELGYLLEEFGAQTAINLDGGGSTALWIKDGIVNIPIDRGVPGQERAVANHLCIFVD
jgi:SH3-like domain-containing protein